MVDQTHRPALEKALKAPLLGTDFPSLGAKYEGKVRDCYSSGDGERVIIVSDRISAFDRVLGTLPLKGQVLNQLAAFWFEKTKDQVPNHVLRVPDPNAIVARDCTPLPVEMVMRAYITGVTSTSIWTHYRQGKRDFCGHTLPDGLVKNAKLPAPILTPSTKAAKGGHDESVSRAQILERGVVSAADLDRAAELAAKLFAIGQAHCEAQGLILVDTKYEFGRTADGEIVVIDEIHTPDSSRYWLADSYAERMAKGEEPESFDKEYVRRFLAAQGFTGDGAIPPIPDEVRVEASLRYIAAFEKITGTPFAPDVREPLPRLKAALGA